MSRIYASAVDHINNHPYKVLASPYYSPHLPEPFMEEGFDPFYTSATPNHPVFAMMPIKYLIDMHSTRHSFTVVEDIDVVRIFHSLDAYLIEIKDSIPINPGVCKYAEKTLALRSQAYIQFLRALNRNPEWRLAYGQGASQLLKLFELFAVPDFEKRKSQMDPIEQLRAPPVTLVQNNPSATGVSSNITVNLSGVPYYHA